MSISLFGWQLLVHDDGWLILDRHSIIRHKGTAPNTGHRRPWWQRRTW